MSKRLDACLAKGVVARERGIQFGDNFKKEWRDVEADEVDLGKEFVTDNAKDKLRWLQWAGIVERGRPSSLVLFRTKPKLTSRRAPGPGPIKKSDWYPMAKKWLKGRKILLHTDGARSYKLGLNRKNTLDGVIHDYVTHKPKKDGKFLRPKYVQLFAHSIDGSTTHTKGGTQIIDRCWQHIRKFVGRRSAAGSSQKRMDARVRAAQWAYWHQDDDLFLKVGEVFRRRC